MSIMTKYSDLYLERQRLEAELEDVKQQLKEVEPEVLSHLADIGSPELIAKATTGQRVRLKIDRKLWASVKTGENSEKAGRLLVDHFDLDLAKMSIHGGSLSAFIRNTFDPDGDTPPEEVVSALPEELRELINVSEKIQIMAYPSSKK